MSLQKGMGGKGLIKAKWTQICMSGGVGEYLN